MQSEVNILKPDIILFLSGPYYDNILKEQFENIKYKNVNGFTKRQLAKLKMDNVDYSFRTYHPNYLYRNDINKYFDAIIEMIKINN